MKKVESSAEARKDFSLQHPNLIDIKSDTRQSKENPKNKTVSLVGTELRKDGTYTVTKQYVIESA